MSKTVAPLLSFDASGQIASSLVYSRWKGRAYARRYVVPSNPQSTEQTVTRNAFSFLQSVIKVMGPLALAPWTAYATGKVMTNRNAFTKFNLPVLRGEADLTNFIGSPGALGGLPPIGISAADGTSQVIEVTVTPPATLPTGWTIAAAVAIAIEEQDPDSGVDFATYEAEDTSSPYQCDITAIAGTFQVRAWLRWNRPDGSIAYSPSIDDTVVVA